MSEEHYKRTHPLCRIPIIHPAVLFDDCESSFLWTAAGTGADYVAEHDPAAAYVQTNGIILQTKLTTPAANDVVTLNRVLWLPPQMLVRLQFVFAFPSTAISCQLRVWLNWYSPAIQYAAGFAANPQLGTVYRVNGFVGVEPTWLLADDLTIPLIDKAWNKFDLSLNWQTALHHLLHFNNTVLDLSDLAITQQDGIGPSFMSLHVELETLQIAQATAYLDQILLTSDNP